MGRASGGVGAAAGVETGFLLEKATPGTGVVLPGELMEYDVPPPTMFTAVPVDALIRVSVTRAPGSGSLLPDL
jgi:hypothetical protein